MVVYTHTLNVRCDMWIPTPIYERLPQFWLLLGLLFMASAVMIVGFKLGCVN